MLGRAIGWSRLVRVQAADRSAKSGRDSHHTTEGGIELGALDRPYIVAMEVGLSSESLLGPPQALSKLTHASSKSENGGVGPGHGH